MRYNFIRGLIEVAKLKNKNKRGKVMWGRVYELLYIIVYPILSVLLLLIIQKYSDRYTILAGIILFIIYAILFLSVFYKNKIVVVARRVMMLVVCIAIGFTSLKMNNISKAIDDIIDNKENTIVNINMDVLTLKDGIIQVDSLEAIDDQVVVGFQTANDNKASEYVEAELKKANITNYRKLSYSDYNTMFHDFYNGYVNVIVVNQEQKKKLPDSFLSLYDDVSILKTYTYTYDYKVEENNIDITKDVFTVLISASENTDEPVSNSLSDMNMLVIINPKTNEIQTISVPRDAFVPNPAYDYANDKLTHTGNDGVANTKLAIENMMQIDIDFYVKISFTSLIKIVDTLDGIDVDVQISFVEQDENRSFEEADLIRLDAGYQHINGKQALAYARHRSSYVDQDLGRNRAQTDVIKGIIKKLMSADGIQKIEDVLALLPNYVIMNFSSRQVNSFIKAQIASPHSWSFKSTSLASGLASTEMTASWNTPLAMYYLSLRDVNKVNALYHLNKEDYSFDKTKFDVNDLYSPYSKFEDKEMYNLVP